MGKGRLRSRYRRIVGFFAGATVSFMFWEGFLPRLGLARLVERTRSRRLSHVAVHFRDLALRMGGVMIKVGQFLSSRLDVLPAEVTAVLASLQDEVPAEAYAAIARLAEALSVEFETFEEHPLAAASLGQVHRARLTQELASGLPFRDVVVKVQRPGI